MQNTALPIKRNRIEETFDQCFQFLLTWLNTYWIMYRRPGRIAPGYDVSRNRILKGYFFLAITMAAFLLLTQRLPLFDYSPLPDISLRKLFHGVQADLQEATFKQLMFQGFPFIFILIVGTGIILKVVLSHVQSRFDLAETLTFFLSVILNYVILKYLLTSLIIRAGVYIDEDFTIQDTEVRNFSFLYILDILLLVPALVIFCNIIHELGVNGFIAECCFILLIFFLFKGFRFVNRSNNKPVAKKEVARVISVAPAQNRATVFFAALKEDTLYFLKASIKLINKVGKQWSVSTRDTVKARLAVNEQLLLQQEAMPPGVQKGNFEFTISGKQYADSSIAIGGGKSQVIDISCKISKATYRYIRSYLNKNFGHDLKCVFQFQAISDADRQTIRQQVPWCIKFN